MIYVQAAVYLASLYKQSCSCYPVHPSLTRVVHLLHLSFSLEAFGGENATVFSHCLVQQTPDKSPGFETLSQHQVLLITIVNNGTETQDCWVLFLALHPPSCVNLDSISLLWETSSSTTASAAHRLMRGLNSVLWIARQLSDMNHCKGAKCNEWMIIEYLIKTSLMFLTPGGRNICVCINHSHPEFNYCSAFAVPCVLPSCLKNRQYVVKQNPFLANSLSG